ncbi:cell wall-active antibiotics response protein [candidate division KSB1 bacterium]|nr:cell wall-active antibiotics response protein [candidate division KSB1 bacterium]
MSKSKSSELFWGVLLITLGVVFLLAKLDIMDIGDFFRIFWPVILIVIGFKLILNRNAGGSAESSKETLIQNDEQAVKYSKVFGDVKLRLESQDFRGGSISTMLGEIDIDLSELNIKEGEQTLTLSGVIGEISVLLPKTLKVSVKTNVTIGDIKILDKTDDGFFINRTYQSEGYETAKKKLYISVSQVIGDIEIRRSAS